MNKKKCKWCHSTHVKKNGRKGGRQLYKCLDCNRQFVGGNRVDDETIITDYIDNKLTLRQLSDKYSLSVRTVWERLKNMRHVHVVSKYRDVVINMDTTYWGETFRACVDKGCIPEQSAVA